MAQVQYLQSELLLKAGVKHGWFMRYGGVSKGLFESLNGKKGIGDPDENVVENRRRAFNSVIPAQAGIQYSNNALAHIVHTFKTNILLAKDGGEFQGYDAGITIKKGLVLSQTTADCGSIIITDTAGSVVALVHGSWHTLSANIICDVIAKIKKHTNKEIIAGIGPMICSNCYEYGSEAKDLFDAQYITESGAKCLIDLKQIIIDQLHECGVSEIDDLNVCTLEDDRFFSHRKNGANSGRFITLVTKCC